ncbi:MAG: putative two-component system response regulator [Anaerolineaceae bacterium]|nr:MAG: putative two-component system response regulator [Anaerolineaceae bacterium]
MTKILLVEDDTLLLEVMRSILEVEGYELFPAPNGKQALDLFVAIKPDLVVSDIMMPEMDGYELLESVRSTPQGVTVPFLFLSARTERNDVSRARSLGVDDYLFKPFDAPELVNAVRARLDRRRQVELFDTRAAHLQTVIMLANVIETRDPYTAGHLERVRRLALNLAFALNWGNEDITVLEFGAILHDIGKIIVPSLVLKKTGPLDEEEWKLMRQHPEAGARMLEGVDHLRAAIPYVLYHHEWWNGSGYPRGLKGEDIPREGRLLAIVDAFDAMTTNRPYHSSMSADAGMDELKRNRSIYFDPEMVDVFVRTYRR